MNVNTGEIKRLEEIGEDEKGNYVVLGRDLTEVEKCNKQLLLYGPCGCGSGKKFKFCCHKAAK